MANNPHLRAYEDLHSYLQKQQQVFDRKNNKKVYLISLDILPSNITRHWVDTLDIYPQLEELYKRQGLDIEKILNCEKEIEVGTFDVGEKIAYYFEMETRKGEDITLLGIRYSYGNFHQTFQQGWQMEGPSYWTHHRNLWERSMDSQSLVVSLYPKIAKEWKGENLRIQVNHDVKVFSTPYFYPFLREDSGVNNLVLFKAKGYDGSVDFHSLRNGFGYNSFQAEEISTVCYPNLYTAEGRELYLKQTYFLISSSLQWIFREHLQHGRSLSELREQVSIYLPMTPLRIGFYECMRMLMDDHSFPWNEALDITTCIINYTPMNEAFHWSNSLLQKMLPRISDIKDELRKRDFYIPKRPMPWTMTEGRWFVAPMDVGKLKRNLLGPKYDSYLMDLTVKPNLFTESFESILDFYRLKVEEPFRLMPNVLFVFGGRIDPADTKTKETVKKFFELKEKISKLPKVGWQMDVKFVENLSIEKMRSLMPNASVLIGNYESIPENVEIIYPSSKEEITKRRMNVYFGKAGL